MAFVVGFPGTRRRHDSIWVIIDMLIKLAYFLTIKIFFSVEDNSMLYILEILKLDGVFSIIWSGVLYIPWFTVILMFFP